MLIYCIDNNIIISHPFYSGLFQDESKNWYLYQDISIFVGLEPKIKTTKTAVQVIHAIINMWKNSSIYYLMGVGCSRLLSFIPNIDGETCTASWVFLIRFSDFTTNHVYSVVYNQYVALRDIVYRNKHHLPLPRMEKMILRSSER